jgi:hypothetical protein
METLLREQKMIILLANFIEATQRFAEKAVSEPLTDQ